MKRVISNRTFGITGASIAIGAMLAMNSGLAAAAAATNSGTATSKTTNQQARLSRIISTGDQEISRRLTTLGTLTSKISAAVHISASDKATLTSEVSATTTGLSTLKNKLDTETTVSAALGDRQDIFTEYRVYALVVPKVHIVKVADDQQVAETKLGALAQKLQTRITAAQQAGKDVTSLQNTLADMNAKISASRGISAGVETNVMGLQPTDYNNDHTILSGYNTQLKTAHSDNAAAAADAKTIAAGLKNL